MYVASCDTMRHVPPIKNEKSCFKLCTKGETANDVLSHTDLFVNDD